MGRDSLYFRPTLRLSEGGPRGSAYAGQHAPLPGTSELPAYCSDIRTATYQVSREFPAHSLWEIHRLLPRANVFVQCVVSNRPRNPPSRAYRSDTRGIREDGEDDLSMTRSDVRTAGVRREAQDCQQSFSCAAHSSVLLRTRT